MILIAKLKVSAILVTIQNEAFTLILDGRGSYKLIVNVLLELICILLAKHIIPLPKFK